MAKQRRGENPFESLPLRALEAFQEQKNENTER